MNRRANLFACSFRFGFVLLQIKIFVQYLFDVPLNVAADNGRIPPIYEPVCGESYKNRQNDNGNNANQEDVNWETKTNQKIDVQKKLEKDKNRKNYDIEDAARDVYICADCWNWNLQDEPIE